MLRAGAAGTPLPEWGGWHCHIEPQCRTCQKTGLAVPRLCRPVPRGWHPRLGGGAFTFRPFQRGRPWAERAVLAGAEGTDGRPSPLPLQCEWLLGDRKPSPEELDQGIDPDSPLFRAILDNPVVQLGLTNPKTLLGTCASLTLAGEGGTTQALLSDAAVTTAGSVLGVAAARVTLGLEAGSACGVTSSWAPAPHEL